MSLRVTLSLLVISGLWPAAAACAEPVSANSGASAVSMDASALARGRFSRLHALLEKTFLGIDVLTLELRVDSATADALGRLIGERPHSQALADEAASLLIACDEAYARTVFLRDLSVAQFLGGVRESLDAARRAGILTAAEHRSVAGRLHPRFAFLDERGLHEGDVLLYRIHGDAVRTQYWSARGEKLLDRVDTGAAGRIGLMGGYFAPGADLRDGLLRSLF